jgi:glycosyltransferase involved in cell wall biosynthesis
MRLLFVITDLIVAGAQFQVLYLARYFRGLGWDVHVVSMVDDTPLRTEFENLDITVSTLQMSNGVPDPRGALRLAKIIRDWQPDIVNSHMVHANLIARVTRLIAKMPALICTAHNINEGGRWREIAYRYTDFLCDITVNVSHAGAKRSIEVGSVPTDRVLVIHPGVDGSRFQEEPDTRDRIRHDLNVGSRFVWVAVGRFEDNKDYPTMLDAFETYWKEYSASSLLIVGNGPLEETLKRLVLERGLSDAVHFLGIRRDVPALMAAADGYLMSSAWEGLPAVLLEACASGLPIVTTDVGGNREVVLDQETGFVVQPKDPGALAQAMSSVAEMSVLERRELGIRARQYFAENFSLEKIAKQWGDLYLQYLYPKE